MRDIAEQTSLLALHAAIDDPRASEQGRDLTVVADDLRRLASRTHSSTGCTWRITCHLHVRAQRAVQNKEAILEISRACSDNVRVADGLFERIGAAMSAASDSSHEVKRAAKDQGRIAATANSRLIGVQRTAAETAKDVAECLETLFNRSSRRVATTTAV
jgi:methyl-accepting chemotaxis protein